MPQRVKKYHRRTYASIYICMHIRIYMHIHTCAPLQRVCHRCVRWYQRNICITYTPAHALVPRTSVTKYMQHPLQKKITYMHTNTHMRMYTYAHEYTCAFMTPPKHAAERLLRLTIYSQICIHIHIQMHIHAYAYLDIYTCIYIHIYMFVHTHTYTFIHTHIQDVHMHAHKHAWNDGAVATAWEARLDATKAPHFSSRSGSAASVLRDPFDEKRQVSAETNTTNSNSSHHHDSAPPRLQQLICIGTEQIHPVYTPPKLRATEQCSENRFHIFTIFPHFSWLSSSGQDNYAPMLVFSTPTNTLCSLAGRLRRPQARLLVFCTLLQPEFRHRLLPPEVKRATKCNNIRQGQWYCTGCHHSEGTGEYAVTWENKVKCMKSLDSSDRFTSGKIPPKNGRIISE